MAVGKEIKRLREEHHPKISVAKAASLIGIDAERLRKWEQRDSDPTDLEDAHKIETYFGIAMNDLKQLDNFKFFEQGSMRLSTKIKMSNQPVTAERSSREMALEYENIQLRINNIEANLNEVLSNQKVLMSMMAVAMNNAEYLKPYVKKPV